MLISNWDIRIEAGREPNPGPDPPPDPPADHSKDLGVDGESLGAGPNEEDRLVVE